MTLYGLEAIPNAHVISSLTVRDNARHRGGQVPTCQLREVGFFEASQSLHAWSRTLQSGQSTAV